MRGIGKIVVLVPDIPTSRAAVHAGVSVARPHGSELVVLHVQHDPLLAEGFNLPFISLSEEYLRLLAEARETLARAISEERTGGIPIREVVVEGDPLRKVLETVESEKADLLVLLAHGEGRFEHFLFGRLHDELVRRMPCSILLVKGEGSG